MYTVLMLSKQTLIRASYGTALVLSILATISIGLLLESKNLIFNSSDFSSSPAKNVEPFPVSVNIHTQVIEDNPLVNQYFTNTLAEAPNSSDRWWNKVAAVFANKGWYQNLASPVSRIVVIWPGERKEEVTKHIGDILRWDESSRVEFERLINSTSPSLTEGKYFPGQYVAHRGATPADISNLIETSFQTEVLDRYTPTVESQVPFEDALIVASLLEREASDFANMREVAGVIWNRLFIDMPLQLDATLQYVKGSDPYQPKWWPKVSPADKFLKSDFNTYQNSGLPPTPIANPSAEAILAALNPAVTDCLYYFHAKNSQYYCSITYKEHVSKLRSIYGRGS